MNKNHRLMLLAAYGLTACSLAPEFKTPEMKLPESFKESAPAMETEAQKTNWKEVTPLEKNERGEWWKIFGESELNALEEQAKQANLDLKIAALRVEQAKSTVSANAASLLPNLDLGANAMRNRPANASATASGVRNAHLKPYDMYSAQGSLSYELDMFNRVRDNEKALAADAQATQATYQSVLLALQAEVAQNFFALKTVDAERAILREAITMREEAARIMKSRAELGEASEQDTKRTQAELSSAEAEGIALDRTRSTLEHALALLLGKIPTEYSFPESPLQEMPPAIPAGIPSELLARRPDIAAAIAGMQAANARIGVAKAAFLPSIELTASGGFQSIALADLFAWSSQAWTLGQLAGSAITMPIFDNGRNKAKLERAKAAYEESVTAYRAAVLNGFRDVEDNLSEQKLLSEQALHTSAAAESTTRVTELAKKRYEEGETNYFEVISADRDSLAARRAEIQIRGQRFLTTVTLIRALGGGW